MPEKNEIGVYSIPKANMAIWKEAPSAPPLRAGEREQYAPEPAEAALQSALDAAEPRATAAIAGEDFAAAMAALASLRACGYLDIVDGVPSGDAVTAAGAVAAAMRIVGHGEGTDA